MNSNLQQGLSNLKTDFGEYRLKPLKTDRYRNWNRYFKILKIQNRLLKSKLKSKKINTAVFKIEIEYREPKSKSNISFIGFEPWSTSLLYWYYYLFPLGKNTMLNFTRRETNPNTVSVRPIPTQATAVYVFIIVSVQDVGRKQSIWRTKTKNKNKNTRGRTIFVPSSSKRLRL